MDATIREDSTQDWALKPQTKSTTPTTITGQQHRTCKVHCPRNAGQIIDGATDDHLCNPAVSTSTQIYPKPQLVYCLSPAGTPLLGNLTATPLPTIEIPPTR